jgi:hypothetical protein
MRKLTIMTALLIIFTTTIPALTAWQYLVDTDIVWQLQGIYQRTAQELIKTGELQYKNAPLDPA